jgi:hypothetical protein
MGHQTLPGQFRRLVILLAILLFCSGASCEICDAVAPNHLRVTLTGFPITLGGPACGQVRVVAQTQSQGELFWLLDPCTPVEIDATERVGLGDTHCSAGACTYDLRMVELRLASTTVELTYERGSQTFHRTAEATYDGTSHEGCAVNPSHLYSVTFAFEEGSQ